MGLAWSSPGAESSECIDTRVCPAAMHARCLAWARLDHWSPVAWYRALNPDGTVQDRTPCHPPLCVVPRSDGTYHLIDRLGCTQKILAQDQVAEFEDVLFCRSVLSPEWQDALEAHMRGARAP